MTAHTVRTDVNRSPGGLSAEKFMVLDCLDDEASRVGLTAAAARLLQLLARWAYPHDEGWTITISTNELRRVLRKTGRWNIRKSLQLIIERLPHRVRMQLSPGHGVNTIWILRGSGWGHSENTAAIKEAIRWRRPSGFWMGTPTGPGVGTPTGPGVGTPTGPPPPPSTLKQAGRQLHTQLQTAEEGAELAPTGPACLPDPPPGPPPDPPPGPDRLAVRKVLEHYGVEEPSLGMLLGAPALTAEEVATAALQIKGRMQLRGHTAPRDLPAVLISTLARKHGITNLGRGGHVAGTLSSALADAQRRITDYRRGTR